MSVNLGGGQGPNDRPWLVPALAAGAGLILVILIVGIGAVLFANRGDDESVPPTETPGRIVLGSPGTPGVLRTPVTPARTPAGGTGAPPAGQPTPTKPAGKAFVVSGTNGEGLNLRTAPGGEQIATIPDGTRLEQIGPDQQVDGVTWRNVRTPDGQEGWVAAEFTTEAP